MGSFDDIPGIKVETKALYEFAKSLTTEVPKDLTGVQKAFEQLPIKVGGSQLPSAASMANWHNKLLYSLSVHVEKLGLGTGALGEASTAVGTIYQNSDVSASDAMNAVNSTFNPKAGDKTFSDRNEEAQRQAEKRGSEQREAINDRAGDVTFEDDGSNRSPTMGPVACTAGGSTTNADRNNAIAAVKNHSETYGENESKGYYAPSDTPEEYREEGPNHVPNMRPVPQTYYPTPYPTSYGTAPIGTTNYPSYPSPAPQTAPTAPTTTTTTSSSTAPTSAPTSSTAPSEPAPKPTTRATTAPQPRPTATP